MVVRLSALRTGRLYPQEIFANCVCLACIIVILCVVFVVPYAYLLYLMCICFTMCVLTLDDGLLARSQYPEGPATGHLDTGFSCFPCVYKRMPPDDNPIAVNNNNNDNYYYYYYYY
jgi:hypothetical protein